MLRPNRPAAPPAGAGVHQGRVTRVDGGEVYVELPRVAAGLEFGPCLTCEVATPFEAGDAVLVAFVEGRTDDPAVVCRLA